MYYILVNYLNLMNLKMHESYRSKVGIRNGKNVKFDRNVLRTMQDKNKTNKYVPIPYWYVCILIRNNSKVHSESKTVKCFYFHLHETCLVVVIKQLHESTELKFKNKKRSENKKKN